MMTARWIVRNRQSGWAPVRTPCRAVALVLLAMPFVHAPALAQGSTRAVAGFVRDSAGLTIRGAEVSIDGTAMRATTSELGQYRIEGLPSGTHVLTARRLGFRPGTARVTAEDGVTMQADFTLTAVAQRLAPVVVAEKREPYDARLAGFNARKTRKVGTIITREAIDQSTNTTITQMLRRVPSVRIGAVRNGPSNAVRLRGANCPPLVFVDGFPATAGEFDLDGIDIGTLEGIEIYPSATSVPSEFVSPRNLDRCGVIALWSRPAPARRPKPGAPSPPPVDLARLIASEQVYSAEEVDTLARPMDGAIRPTYPDSLWRAGVGGRVVAEFVVSAEGEVEAPTIGIVSSTHALFSAAVREALASAVFTPAWAGGRRVRQAVQLPIEFQPPASRSDRGG
jgi:TonB family protein